MTITFVDSLVGGVRDQLSGGPVRGWQWGAVLREGVDAGQLAEACLGVAGHDEAACAAEVARETPCNRCLPRRTTGSTSRSSARTGKAGPGHPEKDPELNHNISGRNDRWVVIGHYRLGLLPWLCPTRWRRLAIRKASGRVDASARKSDRSTVDEKCAGMSASTSTSMTLMNRC